MFTKRKRLHAMVHKQGLSRYILCRLRRNRKISDISIKKEYTMNTKHGHFLGIVVLFAATIFSFNVTGCDDGSSEVDDNPALTGTVSITGTAQVGQTLTANTSQLGGNGTISYQWKRGAAANAVSDTISGATGATYTLVEADKDKYVAVTVTRAGYSGSITSSATAQVAAAGSNGANGQYAGTTWRMFDSALGLNTVTFGNDTVTFTGTLFTNQTSVHLKNDPSRNVTGTTGYSSVITYDGSTGWTTVYYDIQGSQGIQLGRIAGTGATPATLSVFVTEPSSQNSTRTFNKEETRAGAAGAPQNLSGYLYRQKTSTGTFPPTYTWKIHIEWGTVSGASNYQICFVGAGGTEGTFNASGTSNGRVSTNSFDGVYPYLIADNPELRSFVVRADSGAWSSAKQFLPNEASSQPSQGENGRYSNTTWRDGTSSSANTISFGTDTVTLTGSYWGTSAGTHTSYITGDTGVLVAVIVDAEQDLGFRLILNASNQFMIQGQTPYYFTYYEE